MAEFFVEHQGWTHWPKVLLMCRKHGDGIERRRYVPDPGECNDVSESEFSFRCSACDATDIDFKWPTYCHGCGRRVAKADPPF